MKQNILKGSMSDNYAFVLMNSDEGFKRIMEDDVRLFGLCIKVSGHCSALCSLCSLC